ncbi:class I SAM-dependent methyltransferase [Paenibacillus sp. N4]|uniref:class I SAM-dependent methyltransferase n=1 Tax=Paenibacillus vietnamensis TaxID=2590547 RepID=UPI001CD164A1|nr:methyltransferase domain-containing protein [Paenibacillus vietnamensis]MCA0754669.1 class I SAM-dependent methyltransferase [Paenibacillus vietnamensis]
MAARGYEQVGVAMTCRGYDEYLRMFDLNEKVLSDGEVLDVAAGGSSFTAEANARGFSAIAADPRYNLELAQWIMEAEREIETSTAKLVKLADSFDWSYYGSIDRHRDGRKESLARFEADVMKGDAGDRYIGASLPELPFEDNRFSLVLCSHFLFLYADQFGYDFHKESVNELMRVCRPGGQIRIYPLLSLSWEPYSGLAALMEHIEGTGARAELRSSHLPFIPGSGYMLGISL